MSLLCTIIQPSYLSKVTKKYTSNSYLLTAQTSMEKSPPTTLLTVDERVCVFVTQVPKKCDIFVCQFMHCQKEEKAGEKRDSKNNVVTKA